jgi:F0F1-type ATP synthase assembly protein I
VLQYVVKILLSACVIVLVSELAKRQALLGALVASLPLTSILAFCWLYHDTRDAAQVATLSTGILWLVLPSLVLFLALPKLLLNGVPFLWSLLLACALTASAYLLMLWLLPKLGIHLA